MASPVMGTLRPLFSIEEACRLGADAVICMGMIGFPEEPSSLQNLAGFTADAVCWGMPVIAEMLFKPKEGARTTVEDLGFAMRIGAELGGRDHSTVLHACDKIDREMHENEELRRELAAVREMIYQD